MLTTLINTTILFEIAIVLLSILSLAAARLRLPAAGACFQSFQRGLGSNKAIFAILLLGTISGVGFRMYLSYLAPGDILQNTISAREFVRGRSLYPGDLNDLVLAELRDHPPTEPLSSHLPRLKHLQTDQFAVSRLNMVNAHPPLFSLLMVPVMAVVGVYGPAIVVNLVILILYGNVLLKMADVLFPQIDRSWRRVFIVLGFGWQPVIASVRHASQSLLISSLIILCWYLIRMKRDMLGGAILGFAISLKLYPAVLLLYLILKRWRVFLAAMMVTLVLGVLAWLCVGGQDISRFAAAERVVIGTFGVSRANISLFSVILGAMAMSPTSTGASAVLLATSVLLGAGSVWVTRMKVRNRADNMDYLDFDFAVATCLMCLVSPIVWSHYLSVMILPLAVIAKHGVAWAQDGVEKISFLLLAIVLSLPDPPLLTLSGTLQAVLGRELSWFVSPRTLAVVSAMVWLAALKLRPKNAD